MPHPLWQTLATDAGTALTSAQLDQLDRYLEELIAWNQKLNLTRIVDRADAEVKHVADALTLLTLLPARRCDEVAGARAGRTSDFVAASREGRRTSRATDRPITLADVGTGGGIPGVILAIARPDLRVTLIDSTAKKLRAIEQIVASVGITNVAIRHARIESVSERFDVITARAVADLDTLLGWCEPLMHARSVLLAMKGPRASEEIAAIDPRRRARFAIEVVPIERAELAGHCVVRATRA